MVFTERRLKSENPKRGVRNPGITNEALYRYFKKPSPVVFLCMFCHFPSKNPECTTKKPGGSF